MLVCETWVPEVANPHAEICHAFVYRWLIGRGKMPSNSHPDPISGSYNGAEMKPILFPRDEKLKDVRVGGENKVKKGDIIGFFDTNGALVHSMVAEEPTIWVGANNHGCWATGTGRTTISDVYNNKGRPLPTMGWADNYCNLFMTMTGGPLYVKCRTP